MITHAFNANEQASDWVIAKDIGIQWVAVMHTSYVDADGNDDADDADNDDDDNN